MERGFASECKPAAKFVLADLEQKQEFQEGNSILAQWLAMSRVRKADFTFR
jgi:hypothetical protein